MSITIQIGPLCECGCTMWDEVALCCHFDWSEPVDSWIGTPGPKCPIVTGEEVALVVNRPNSAQDSPDKSD